MSFRMTAVIASFAGFPELRMALSGLKRMATGARIFK